MATFLAVLSHIANGNIMSLQLLQMHIYILRLCALRLGTVSTVTQIVCGPKDVLMMYV